MVAHLWPLPWAKNRPQVRRLLWLWVPVALATTLLLAGCTLIGRGGSTPTATATPTASVATPTPTSPPGGGSPTPATLPSIADLVERVEPAVVSIQVRVEQLTFFGTVYTSGSGSGVIFRQDGYILTNNHVVEDAVSVRVALLDGREFDAEIVGTDRSTDLAVIKIDEEGLPTVPLGDASKLRVGEWVVAIGNALGLTGAPTVTLGVVSAVGRELDTGNATLYDLIQTDAAINRGNSGGPLINLQGEVIGINTAVLREEEAQGIGFAVSAETAIPIAEQLVSHGRVIRPYLGISAREVDFATAAEMDLSVREGVLVVEVVRDGAADRAGIEAGDVIVALDGQPTPNFLTLQRLLITQFKVGQRITVTVVRDSEQKEFTLTLTEFPR